jgi:hypothetical protein
VASLAALRSAIRLGDELLVRGVRDARAGPGATAATACALTARSVALRYGY